MKPVVIIIYSLISCSLMGQTFNVKVNLTNCGSKHLDDRNRNLSVHKGDSLIVQHPKTNSGTFILRKLSRGDYTFRFTNLYEQAIEEIVSIKKSTKKVILCTDKFLETNDTTLFSRLGTNDTLYMPYISQGCFHLIEEELKFYFEGGVLLAEYCSDTNKETKKLRSKDLAYLIEFEKKLRQMAKKGDGGCTTMDIYTLIINGKTSIQVIDSGCEWNGYNKMKKEILGIKD
jgi:hypothetical protein